MCLLLQVTGYSIAAIQKLILVPPGCAPWVRCCPLSAGRRNTPFHFSAIKGASMQSALSRVGASRGLKSTPALPAGLRRSCQSLTALVHPSVQHTHQPLACHRSSTRRRHRVPPTPSLLQNFSKDPLSLQRSIRVQHILSQKLQRSTRVQNPKRSIRFQHLLSQNPHRSTRVQHLLHQNTQRSTTVWYLLNQNPHRSITVLHLLNQNPHRSTGVQNQLRSTTVQYLLNQSPLRSITVQNPLRSTTVQHQQRATSVQHLLNQNP